MRAKSALSEPHRRVQEQRLRQGANRRALAARLSASGLAQHVPGAGGATLAGGSLRLRVGAGTPDGPNCGQSVRRSRKSADVDGLHLISGRASAEAHTIPALPRPGVRYGEQHRVAGGAARMTEKSPDIRRRTGRSLRPGAGCTAPVACAWLSRREARVAALSMQDCRDRMRQVLELAVMWSAQLRPAFARNPTGSQACIGTGRAAPPRRNRQAPPRCSLHARRRPSQPRRPTPSAAPGAIRKRRGGIPAQAGA